MRPLAIDLYCGLGGWTDGLLAEGFNVIGFDIERHEYGDHRYPAQLVVQDVRTLYGSQFKDAALIVASPPCQEYSYMAMPWTLAKAKAKAIREDTTGEKLANLNLLFNECFRIQREASFAAGRHIPLVVENVKGAQPWVGRARWNFGSFYLWGDVPALMPSPLHRRMKFPAHCGPRMWSEREYVRLNDGNVSAFHQEGATKNNGGSWFAIAHNTASGKGQNPDGRKGVGPKWNSATKSGTYGMKRWTNPDEGSGIKSGGDWFNSEQPSISRMTSSKFPARKMASAMIAKIPLPLSRHIGATYRW